MPPKTAVKNCGQLIIIANFAATAFFRTKCNKNWLEAKRNKNFINQEATTDIK